MTDTTTAKLITQLRTLQHSPTPRRRSLKLDRCRPVTKRCGTNWPRTPSTRTTARS